MNKTNLTEVAQIGLFPLGKVSSPVTPAINATTFVVNCLKDLAPITSSSLTEGGHDIFSGLYYGGVDTPTTRHLAARISKVEMGRFGVLTPSGQSAIHLMLAAVTKPGDHLLICDTITYTTRWLLDHHFRGLGVNVEYFEPKEVSTLNRRLQPNTVAVFWESPGAFTFELVDVKSLVEACKGHPAITVMDNTWAASTFFHPLEVGVDVALMSMTKSHAATAGVSLGAIVTNSQDLFEKVKSLAALLGSHVDSESCADALQAMSTLGVRLSHQMASTNRIVEVLKDIAGVIRVFHPALQEERCDVFNRDYIGFNSLVSVQFAWHPDELTRRLDRLKVIKVGYGWGGTISLVNYFDPTGWPPSKRLGLNASCARFYFGLEDSLDIIEDLREALES